MEDIDSILIISKDDGCDNINLWQIETREQFNWVGQRLLKDFEDGELSIEELTHWAIATLRDDVDSDGQEEESEDEDA